MPSTPVDFHSERTGLQLWDRATPSVSVREIQKKCCVGYFSALLPGNRERELELKTNVSTLVSE